LSPNLIPSNPLFGAGSSASGSGLSLSVGGGGGGPGYKSPRTPTTPSAPFAFGPSFRPTFLPHLEAAFTRSDEEVPGFPFVSNAFFPQQQGVTAGGPGIGGSGNGSSITSVPNSIYGKAQ